MSYLKITTYLFILFIHCNQGTESSDPNYECTIAGKFAVSSVESSYHHCYFHNDVLFHEEKKCPSETCFHSGEQKCSKQCRQKRQTSSKSPYCKSSIFGHKCGVNGSTVIATGTRHEFSVECVWVTDRFEVSCIDCEDPGGTRKCTHIVKIPASVCEGPQSVFGTSCTPEVADFTSISKPPHVNTDYTTYRCNLHAEHVCLKNLQTTIFPGTDDTNFYQVLCRQTKRPYFKVYCDFCEKQADGRSRCAAVKMVPDYRGSEDKKMPPSIPPNAPTNSNCNLNGYPFQCKTEGTTMVAIKGPGAKYLVHCEWNNDHFDLYCLTCQIVPKQSNKEICRNVDSLPNANVAVTTTPLPVVTTPPPTMMTTKKPKNTQTTTVATTTTTPSVDISTTKKPKRKTTTTIMPETTTQPKTTMRTTPVPTTTTKPTTTTIKSVVIGDVFTKRPKKLTTSMPETTTSRPARTTRPSTTTAPTTTKLPTSTKPSTTTKRPTTTTTLRPTTTTRATTTTSRTTTRFTSTTSKTTTTLRPRPSPPTTYRPAPSLPTTTLPPITTTKPSPKPPTTLRPTTKSTTQKSKPPTGPIVPVVTEKPVIVAALNCKDDLATAYCNRMQLSGDYERPVGSGRHVLCRRKGDAWIMKCFECDPDLVPRGDCKLVDVLPHWDSSKATKRPKLTAPTQNSTDPRQNTAVSEAAKPSGDGRIVKELDCSLEKAKKHCPRFGGQGTHEYPLGSKRFVKCTENNGNWLIDCMLCTNTTKMDDACKETNMKKLPAYQFPNSHDIQPLALLKPEDDVYPPLDCTKNANYICGQLGGIGTHQHPPNSGRLVKCLKKAKLTWVVFCMKCEYKANADEMKCNEVKSFEEYTISSDESVENMI